MANKILVDQDTAEKTVNEWLDAKRVKPSERTEKAGFINTLVEAVMYGDITIDEKYVITHKLVFGLTNDKDEVTVSELKYQPRASTGDLQSKTANLKGIGMAVYQAYASTLTGQVVAILNRMDSEDFKILQAIVSFFL